MKKSIIAPKRLEKLDRLQKDFRQGQLVVLRTKIQDMKLLNSNNSPHILHIIRIQYLLLLGLRLSIHSLGVLDVLDRPVVGITKGLRFVSVVVIPIIFPRISPTINLCNLHLLLWDFLSKVSSLHFYHLYLHHVLLRVTNSVFLGASNTIC